jgi:hypothetical protein
MMAQKQESNYNLELLTDREIYATIHYLDPDPGSANKQLAQLTDAEIYAVIRYLDPDAGSENKQDHFTAIVISIGAVLLAVLSLEFMWFYQ